MKPLKLIGFKHDHDTLMASCVATVRRMRSYMDITNEHEILTIGNVKIRFSTCLTNYNLFYGGVTKSFCQNAQIKSGGNEINGSQVGKFSQEADTFPRGRGCPKHHKELD